VIRSPDTTKPDPKARLSRVDGGDLDDFKRVNDSDVRRQGERQGLPRGLRGADADADLDRARGLQGTSMPTNKATAERRVRADAPKTNATTG